MLSLSLLNLRSCSHILQDNILFLIILNIINIFSLFTFHFLRLKQKMDYLLFLIKKHNNKYTAGYNDKLAYIIY